MFWRFGFSSTSTLDTLLDRPNVTLEEVLDEDELLQECKTQNAKLVNYLQQPRVLKRLFEHVVGTAEVGGAGGREWEEKVRFKYPYVCSEVLSSDIWSVVETALNHSEELLLPFWQSILSRDMSGNPPTIAQHQHPLFVADAQPHKPGQTSSIDSAHNLHDGNSPGAENSNVGVLGLEVISSDHGSTITNARENGPGKSVLSGYWAKVNGVFLDKKPREMIEFIRSTPRIVELFVAHMETPAVVDLLYRIIQCEEVVPNIGVIDWLAAEDLMPRLIDLLSPSHSADMHNTVSELLKAIIALSAPSPASLTQNGATEAFGFGNAEQGGNAANGAVGGVNNRLVRELASDAIVQKMVGFMLDASLPSRLSGKLSEAANESAAEAESTANSSVKPESQSAIDENDEEDVSEFEAALTRRTPLNPRDTPASEQTRNSYLSSGMFDHHRDSTTTVRPSDDFFGPINAPQIAVTSESCTSTLVTCIGVLIELIRKNNSDYFEQHLFHTLRTHLLQRQQEIAERKANKTASPVEGKEEDKEEDLEAGAIQNEQKSQTEEDADDEMEGMEEAMAELSDKLGIVHLGPMLKVLCERLPDFQLLIARPRVEEAKTVNSLGKAPALTFERYRITELYAELLHCSNMALLNRIPNEGPQYSEEGVLLGGIEGLQVLARTLQGTDAASESGQDHTTADAPKEGDAEVQSKNDISPTAEAGQSAETTTEPDKASKGSGHSRQISTVDGRSGANGSEDTDDDALLNEVSASVSAGDSASPQKPGESSDPNDVSGHAGDVEGKQAEAGTSDADLKSVLSHLSLADLTTPSASPSRVPSPIDDKREYVVGDQLKRKFLECNVIPTILDLFFEYPWNNFLHNVVYDILQQFFNGRMDVGLNRQLTLAVFMQGKMTDKILQGHRRNEESLKMPRKIRMGYMGHMHLIAEETVKVLERYPEEIAHFVQPCLTDEWRHFVSETLKENREKESAPLAGGRPQMLQSLAFPQHGGGDGDLGGAGQHQVVSDAFASYLSSQMSGGANASDDDDDSDEDTNWLSHDLRHRGGDIESGGDGFDDAFSPSAANNAFGTSRRGHDLDDSKDDDDDDDWGPFADSSSSSSSAHINSGVALSSSAQAYLTPADLAADFQREQSAADANRFDDATDDASSTMSPFEDGAEGAEEDFEQGSNRARSDSGSSENAGGTPFVDLLDSASVRAADVVAAAHARRPSLDQLEGVTADALPRIQRPRGYSNSSSSSESPPDSGTDSGVADAIKPHDSLGPGISPDAQADQQSGMIERTIDGETVKVPLDDLALMAAQNTLPASAAAASNTNESESAVADEES